MIAYLQMPRRWFHAVFNNIELEIHFEGDIFPVKRIPNQKFTIGGWQRRGFHWRNGMYCHTEQYGFETREVFYDDTRVARMTDVRFDGFLNFLAHWEISWKGKSIPWTERGVAPGTTVTDEGGAEILKVKHEWGRVILEYSGEVDLLPVAIGMYLMMSSGD